MLNLILNVSESCNDAGLAVILATIKKFMNILWIIGPIMAIVGAGIALFKLLNNPEEKKYKNLFKNMILALFILFLLPGIINVVMGMFDGKFDLATCWNQAEIINETGSQDSNYIDPNKGNKTQITTDPSEFEGKTGEKNSTSN